MRIGELFQGSLFAGDLLVESIIDSADWAVLEEEALHDIEGLDSGGARTLSDWERPQRESDQG